jgi:hypothetical protein
MNFLLSFYFNMTFEWATHRFVLQSRWCNDCGVLVFGFFSSLIVCDAPATTMGGMLVWIYNPVLAYVSREATCLQVGVLYIYCLRCSVQSFFFSKTMLSTIYPTQYTESTKVSLTHMSWVTHAACQTNRPLFCYHEDMALPPWWSPVSWLGTCICGPVISDNEPSLWQFTRASYQTVRPVQWSEAAWHINENHCSSCTVALLPEHKGCVQFLQNSKNFTRFPVTSNLWTHTWSIKYR